MIQQRTGFVPPHTGQNHCSAAVIGRIKHIITKCKCKITLPCQWDPANHQDLEWSLQNEAVPLLVFLLSEWSSYEHKRFYIYTLKQAVCLSHWSISLRAPSGRKQRVKAYSHKAWAPLKLLTINQVIHGATARISAFKIIIWMVKTTIITATTKKQSPYCVTTVEFRFDIQKPEDPLVDSDFKLLSLADCSFFCSSALQWMPEQLCIISASQNTAWVIQFTQKVLIFSFPHSKRGALY